jgi:mycofactocin precursor
MRRRKAMAQFLPEPAEDDESEFVPEEDLLVEEISIDGMCGVY